jgi:hypothetical protein
VVTCMLRYIGGGNIPWHQAESVAGTYCGGMIKVMYVSCTSREKHDCLDGVVNLEHYVCSCELMDSVTTHEILQKKTNLDHLSDRAHLKIHNWRSRGDG